MAKGKSGKFLVRLPYQGCAGTTAYLDINVVRKTVSATFTDGTDIVIINGKEYVAVNQTCGCCAHYTPEGIKRLTTGGKKLVGR
ncbi:MAG: hypothetical protein WC910_10700 [Bacteroidales bacterium]